MVGVAEEAGVVEANILAVFRLQFHAFFSLYLDEKSICLQL
jgi:hypothetical protein